MSTSTTALRRLAQSLSVQQEYTRSMTTHRNEIESRLRKDFSVARFQPIGSFGNGTNLQYFSDADYLVWLRDRPRDSSALLRSVRASIMRRFPRTNVMVRTPTVRVEFGLGSENVEIVPAGWSRDIGSSEVFWIADGGGGWLESSPDLHNAHVHGEHVRLGYELKSLIRLVKFWNYVNGVGLSSFYLEMRTTEAMRGQAYIMHRYDFPTTMRHLQSVALRGMNDPTLSGGRIVAGPPSRLEQAKRAVARALRTIKNAEEAEKNGYDTLALHYWDEVFNECLR